VIGLRRERIDARFYALRSFGFSALDARDVSKILEYRCVCHERLGGVTVIYSDWWLDAEHWADLYRRVRTHLNGHHALRMREVVDRLDICVP
jgi:hypothetical protein